MYTQNDETLTAKVSRIAHDLARKHGNALSSRVATDAPTLDTRQNNKFKIMEATQPTLKNAVGVDQDGTDFTYFVEVGFGSSAKAMYLLLDTGASSTWVMGSECTSDACKTHNTFGAADSKTLKDTTKTMSIAYGTGEVSGRYVSDTIDLSGLKASLEFGLANTTSSVFNNYPFDGILGLWRGGGTQNFLDALKGAGVITSRIFGVSLARASDGPNDGEVSFGAVNPAKHSGDISYTVLDSKASGTSSWVIPLDEVTVSGKSTGVKGKLANIDTGTTYSFGPPADVEALYKAIPDSQTGDGGVTWTIPCDSKATVAFTFSGKSYTVSSKDFISSAGTNNRCPCNIFGKEVVPGAWLLGAMFLKNVYTVFDIDQSRIGESDGIANTLYFTGTHTNHLAGFASKSTKQTVSSSPGSPTATSNPSTNGGSTTFTTISPSGTFTSVIGTGLTGLHETPSGTTGSAAKETTPAASTTPSSLGEQLEVRGIIVLFACLFTTLAMVV